MAEACMGARGWMRVSTAKQMADEYGRAWQAEVDRHDGIDPGSSLTGKTFAIWELAGVAQW
jgi:hypothetical protein